MNLTLQIKDYDTFTPLINKQIQLTNIDSKQIYTQTTDSRGYVSFNIKESERGDFFNIRLLNDNKYEQNPYFLAKEISSDSQKQQIIKHITQKLITPNNYQNHPAVLYFKAQISLYFNGTTLYIMQGANNLALFDARSGMALSKEEKEQLQQERGYTHFVPSLSNKDLETSAQIATQEYYYCYDVSWHKEGKCLQEATYYINTEQFQENNVLFIYTDKECTKEYGVIGVSDDKSKPTIILKDTECKNECLRYIKNQEIIELKIEIKQEKVQQIVIKNHNTEVFADIHKPFAPGTYIELEAVGDEIKDDTTIYWRDYLQYQDCTKSVRLVGSAFEHIKFVGVHLLSPKTLNDLRAKGYKNFEYIIQASISKQFNANSPQLIFNPSFEIGEGNDKNVREAKNTAQDSTRKIDSLSQAIEYLRMTYLHYEKQQASNKIQSLYEYFKKYPRIAGKIAYIFYRFDISNEGFVRSVMNDNGEYIKDRDEYIQNSKNMILKDSIYQNKYIKIIDEYKNLISHQANIEARKDFAERLIKAVCKKFKLPLQNVIFSQNSGKYGSYDSITQSIEIDIANLGDLRKTIKTIFHEVRHFYINIHYNPNKIANLSILKQYLHWSNQFYILSIYANKLFEKFSKQCDIIDFANMGCVEGYNQNAYEIQPNERDPRYVAAQIIAVLP